MVLNWRPVTVTDAPPELWALGTWRNEATGASKLNVAKSEPTVTPTVTVLLE
jgi:hypothetical protein